MSQYGYADETEENRNIWKKRRKIISVMGDYDVLKDGIRGVFTGF